MRQKNNRKLKLAREFFMKQQISIKKMVGNYFYHLYIHTDNSPLRHKFWQEINQTLDYDMSRLKVLYEDIATQLFNHYAKPITFENFLNSYRFWKQYLIWLLEDSCDEDIINIFLTWLNGSEY